MEARSCLGKRGGRSSAGAQYASGRTGAQGPGGWMGEDKAQDRMQVGWSRACEKRKPSTKGKLGLESVIWVFSS